LRFSKKSIIEGSTYAFTSTAALIIDTSKAPTDIPPYPCGDGMDNNLGMTNYRHKPSPPNHILVHWRVEDFSKRCW
jgi:hypothetical protein